MGIADPIGQPALFASILEQYRYLEWVRREGDTVNRRCGVCDEKEPDGHAADCQLNAAIIALNNWINGTGGIV